MADIDIGGMKPEDVAKVLLGPLGEAKKVGETANKELEEVLNKAKSIKEINDSLKELVDQFEKVSKVLGDAKTRRPRPVTMARGESSFFPEASTIKEVNAGIKQTDKGLGKTAAHTEKIADLYKEIDVRAGFYGKLLGVNRKKFQDMIESTKGLEGTNAKFLENFIAGMENWRELNERQKKYLKLSFRTSARAEMDDQGRLKSWQEINNTMEQIANIGSKFNNALLKTIDYWSIKIKNGTKAVADIGTAFSALAGKVTPSAYGIGRGVISPGVTGSALFDLAAMTEKEKAAIGEAGNFMMDFSKATQASSTAFGSIINQTGTVEKNIWDAAMAQQDILNATGQTAEVWRRQLLRNFTRGIRDQKTTKTLLDTSLSLSTLIGSEVGSTADEMANWNQRLGLSDKQMMTLTRNVREVGKVTGVTGDNLIQAVRSGRELAEAMRDVGTLTDDASKGFIQMSAAATKYGVEKSVLPLIRGVTSLHGFLNETSDQQKNLILDAARMGGVLNKVYTGEIMETEKNQAAFAEGMMKIREQLLGGRDYEKMTKQQQQLLDIQTRARYGVGFGELTRTAKALKEGAMTPAQRAADLERQAAEAEAQGTITSKDQAKKLAKEARETRFTEQITKLGGLKATDYEENKDLLQKAIQNYQAITGKTVGPGTFEDQIREMMTGMEQADVEQAQKNTDVLTATLRKNEEYNARVIGGMQKEFLAGAEKLGAARLHEAEVFKSGVDKAVEIANRFSSAVDKFSEAAKGLNTLLAPFIKGTPPGPGVGPVIGGGAGILGKAVGGATGAGAGYIIMKQAMDWHDANVDAAQANILKTFEEWKTKFLEERLKTRPKDPAAAKFYDQMTDLEVEIQTLAKEGQQWNNELGKRMVQFQRGKESLASGAASTINWLGERFGFKPGLDVSKPETEREEAITDASNKRLGELFQQKGELLKKIQEHNKGIAAGMGIQSDAGLDILNKIMELRSKGVVSPEERSSMMKTLDESAQRRTGGISGPEYTMLTKLLTSNLDNIDQNIGDLHKNATQAKSLYTHDVILEGLLEPIKDMANMIIPLVKPDVNALSPEESSDSIRRRVQQEYASAPASSSMSATNAALDEISSNTGKQIEIMKQELAVLTEMLAAMSMPAYMATPGDTHSNIVPGSPANYFQWAYSTIASPNKGGIENFTRG